MLGPPAEERAANVLELENSYRIDKMQLINAIQKRLAELLPDEPPRIEDGELQQTTRIHGFDVDTVVLRGRRTWQIEYFHRVHQEEIGFRVDRISIKSWLGLASVTYWYEITQKDIEPTAELVRDLCRHFLGAADELLAGLKDATNEPGM